MSTPPSPLVSSAPPSPRTDHLTSRAAQAAYVIANVASGHLSPSHLDIAGLGAHAGRLHIPELEHPAGRHWSVLDTRVRVIDHLRAGWAASLSNGARGLALAGGLTLDEDARWRVSLVLHGRLTDLNEEPTTLAATLAALELTP